ncbi:MULTISPECIES: hypothetical protein [Streptomyces]|uniref:hypothetical protein n=1 Tax=Streptomyces TaxID=1883 RepID=UPI00081B1194|nr:MULTISPECIES: hypothetical protein [unclassified Streptomyces]MYQ52247.1 hypothetical protein [Streptomyces sp. SID4941]SCD78500.1 hypothetical protein GA0115247_113734 [Streptomyces sp. PalvLS-984]SDD71986.1 hypothetical protein F558DRAFT_04698 [Streptomyces sp. AmelKG-A3]
MSMLPARSPYPFPLPPDTAPDTAPDAAPLASAVSEADVATDTVRVGRADDGTTARIGFAPPEAGHSR